MATTASGALPYNTLLMQFFLIRNEKIARLGSEIKNKTENILIHDTNNRCCVRKKGLIDIFFLYDTHLLFYYYFRMCVSLKRNLHIAQAIQ